MKTQLLIIDDQILFAESLRSLLGSRAKDIEVVGVAYDTKTGLGMAERLRPDIVLMDVRMPEPDGVEATRMLLERCPEAKIIMLTMYDDDQYVQRAISNGAIGYLLKDIPPDELLTAIRAVQGGNFLLASSIAGKVVRPATGTVYHGSLGESDLPEWFFVLSRRERQILRLVVEGFNNEEIAEAVNLAVQTVKNYLSNIYAQVNAANRIALIKTARHYLNYL